MEIQCKSPAAETCVVLVLEIQIRNVTDYNKAWMQTPSTYWNDYEPNYDTEDNLQHTTGRTYTGVYSQIIGLDTDYEATVLAEYLRPSST